MSSGVPDTGTARSWFDDVGLIQWDSVAAFTGLPIQIRHPNDYNYLQ